MKSIANHIQTHADALNLRSKRNEILASNIVNSATPNFKARDIDFNQALQARMDVGPVNVSNERHFKFYTGSGDEAAQFRQSINPSVDGNTVELHVEQMQFSENVMRYQTSLEFLNRKFSGLMSAIKGE
ncbi:flagellar basal body rod protein FlgB [Planktomarina temperata]|jgi:flagellar basal-body rod protein FlgB|nr:flagellar basal body rod protein FlgB [Tateyamaria sp.]MDA7451784.1 flagellar basal body rod protein FlgB [Planktomarina temperata]MDA9110174.1 flagellar basal body rod protein FlgB [bacterium]MDA8714232.1 flagellar basal body rod protein FlgB [Planktomarina temperata]MDA9317610.1 flagellar basal body rod protein FlgB [bacterium]